MNRRALLAAVAACGGATVAGCIDGSGSPGTGPNEMDPDDSSGNDSGTGSPEDGSNTRPAGDDPVTPGDGESTESPAPDPDCGLAELSLSELLTDDPGDRDACFAGAAPSFAVENERDESVSAAVAVEIDGEAAFEETYELASGERVVERGSFRAAETVDVTVTVDGATLQGRWDERSCHRHGVAIGPDGLEVGWVEPIQGPGDTQHDCYPGSKLDVEVGNVGEPRTVDVTVADACDGSTTAETFELADHENTRLEDALVSGGNYEVTVDVEGGTEASRTFETVCWGVSVLVEDDGNVRLHQLEID